MAEKLNSFAEPGEILGTDGEKEELHFVYEKDQKYSLVSTIAYLIGVRDRYFGESQNFDFDIKRKLSLNKSARIIRNLCMLRNCFELFYTRIFNEVINDGKEALSSQYIPQNVRTELSADGIKLTWKSKRMPTEYIIEINGYISDRINNCKNIIPEWINWDYIKSIFLMPGGLTEVGIKEEGTKFRENYNCFPYHVYMNWPVPHEDGNILLNDMKFAKLLYLANYDDFRDYNKVMDVSAQIKGNIYDFLEAGVRAVMIVDCENSDVYNMITMLRNLEWEQLQKIAKIVLVNDVHTSLGWQELEKCTDIPIEHIMTQRMIMTQRIMEGKSLVDGQVIAKAFTEFYEEKTDSFVLLSSDSDFWTLIDSLKNKAEFFVMVEHMKCGPDYKEILADAGVLSCYLDDFSDVEESEQMKTDIILRAIDSRLESMSFNVIDMFDSILKEYRIVMETEQRKHFFEKHLKNINVDVNENGGVSIQSRKSK